MGWVDLAPKFGPGSMQVLTNDVMLLQHDLETGAERPPEDHAGRRTQPGIDTPGYCEAADDYTP